MVWLAVLIAAELLVLIAIGICLVANTNILARALGNGAEDWTALDKSTP